MKIKDTCNRRSGNRGHNLKWCYFNRNDLHDGVLLRCHKSGAEFEPNVEPMVGSSILMRLKKWDALDCGDQIQARTIALAKVERCHQAPSEQGPSFRINVRYYEVY